ncbi:outer membrane protein transport protein [bacterium]|nr:outer membrane protein transport protein [candidate division CSSED10-310 bacterium]
MVTDVLALRAGILYDETPIPEKRLDTLLPGNSRYSAQVGGGYRIGDFAVDFTYMYLLFEDRELDAPNANGVCADFGNDAHLLGIQFSYSF